jgi:high-affinity Fe2+/Pb2+ permease
MVGATRSGGRTRPGVAVLLLAVALYLLIVLVRHFLGGVGWADSFLWTGFIGLAVFAAVVYAVLWLLWRRR